MPISDRDNTAELDLPDDTGTPHSAAATDQNTDDEHRGPGAEAAKYRVRLREAEADRDSIKSQLDAAHGRLAAFESGVVRELAGAVLNNADDLTILGGLDADDLPRDEAGEVDREAVRGLVDALAVARPELTVAGAQRARPRTGPPPTGQGNRSPIPPRGPSWAEVFRR